MGDRAPSARITGEHIRPPGPAREEWISVVTHTHVVRSHENDFETTKQDLLAWCRANRIDAIGLGSPWEPVSAGSYRRYEGPDRDAYYSGRVDPQAVMDRDEVQALFGELNAAEGNRTLFYIDNETPKGRRGHLWHFGFGYDAPAWHDYSQDRPVMYCSHDPAADVNGLTGEPHRRRSCLEVVHEERRAGALAIWAHPTSWWREDGCFVTNIAAEIALHLLADGYLDGMTVMGYDPCHRWYQRLWFHLLDTGATVPGFAETDALLDRAGILQGSGGRFLSMWNHFPVRERLGVESIVAAARAGRCFASTGAFLTLTVDGERMGGAVETKPGARHRAIVEAHPVPGEAGLSRVELIGKGGRVLASYDGFPGGSLEFDVAGRDGPHYLVARAFGWDDDPDAPRQQDIRHAAITNPVYLRPAGFRFKAPDMRATLVIREKGPWAGSEMTTVLPDGSVHAARQIGPGETRVTMPANARLVFRKGAAGERAFYPAIENGPAHALVRYLSAGEFLDDFPGLAPGEVPPGAFRLREMAAALGGCRIEL